MPADLEKIRTLNAEDVSAQVLGMTQTLVNELHSASARAPQVRLDSSLDQSLGLDSLSRAELLSRMDKAFGVTFPDSALLSIETPQDIINQLQQLAPQVECAQIKSPPKVLKQVAALPEQVETLQQLLDWHVTQHPERPHMYIYQDETCCVDVSYRCLQQRAMQIAAGLLASGIEPGERVAIMLPTSEAYFNCFYAILYVRAIPVPIYPPARLSQLEDHLTRHASILNNAEVSALITLPQAESLTKLLSMQVPSIRMIATAEQLEKSASDCITAVEDVGDAKTGDIAFLQYTSGSTGIPKGVMLTHANLLANIRAMGKVVGAGPDDVFVSWLPVYHDMGLIGAWFGSLYHAMPLVIMSPLAFLSRPRRWLQAIAHHRGTLSPAPNFAYELCVNKIEDSELDNLDLSSWRLSWNGAEPVSPATIRSFTARFARCGYRPETMSPVYGLAESSVGLVFPDKERVPRIERFKRDMLLQKCKAIPAELDEEDAIELVGLGVPLPGHQIRIVDSLGNEVSEGEEGAVEFSGPSATQGYFNEPEKSRALFHGNWLVTGDRGFTLGGELFLTGRSKDIIIRAGRNIYPQQLEQAVAELAGIRKGCVAVFAGQDQQNGTERLIVVAESQPNEPANEQKLKEQIKALSMATLDTSVDEVVLIPAHSIPKTSSGKIRRAACRELYEQGRLGSFRPSVWLQVMHLFRAGIRPAWQRYLRSVQDLLYASYLWLLMLLIAPLTWLFVVLMPNVKRCRCIVRYAGRILIALSGSKLRIDGMEHLPNAGSPYMLVANHASYLDGLVLLAAIERDYRFVAKAELRVNPITYLFLKHLGCEFVERFDTQQGVADAGHLVTTAQTAEPLLIFPEGMFGRMAGLHEFHMGAFIAAAKGSIPVVPMTLCGTRAKLRGNSLFPRRGDITLSICPAISPEGTDWHSALALRDKVRQTILRLCGEPDLSHSR